MSESKYQRPKEVPYTATRIMEAIVGAFTEAPKVNIRRWFRKQDGALKNMEEFSKLNREGDFKRILEESFPTETDPAQLPLLRSFLHDLRSQTGFPVALLTEYLQYCIDTRHKVKTVIVKRQDWNEERLDFFEENAYHDDNNHLYDNIKKNHAHPLSMAFGTQIDRIREILGTPNDATVAGGGVGSSSAEKVTEPELRVVPPDFLAEMVGDIQNEIYKVKITVNPADLDRLKPEFIRLGLVFPTEELSRKIVIEQVMETMNSPDPFPIDTFTDSWRPPESYVLHDPWTAWKHSQHYLIFSVNSSFHLRDDQADLAHYPILIRPDGQPIRLHLERLERLVAMYAMMVSYYSREAWLRRYGITMQELFQERPLDNEPEEAWNGFALCSKGSQRPDPTLCRALQLDFVTEIHLLLQKIENVGDSDEEINEIVERNVNDMYYRFVKRVCQVEIVKSTLIRQGQTRQDSEDILDGILYGIAISGSHVPFDQLSVFSKLAFVRLLQNDFLHWGGVDDSADEDDEGGEGDEGDEGDGADVAKEDQQLYNATVDARIRKIVMKVQALLKRVLNMDSVIVADGDTKLDNFSNVTYTLHGLPDLPSPREPVQEPEIAQVPVQVLKVSETAPVQVKKEEPEQAPEPEPEPEEAPEPEQAPEQAPEPEPKVADTDKPVSQAPNNTSKPRQSDLSNALVKELNRNKHVKKVTKKPWDSSLSGQPPKLGGASEPSDRSDGLSAFLGIAVSLAVVVASAIAGAAKGG